MLTKKILKCFFAACLLCCFSSFVTVPASPVKQEAPLAIVDLYQQFTVAGVNYNVYFQYDTVSGTVSGFQVFLDDCTRCRVTGVSGSATFSQISSFMWQTTSGAITVTTSCGTFVISGLVPSQLPYC